MKRILMALPILTILLTGCPGIPKMLTEEESIIQKIVEVPGYTKDQIFERSKMWIAENFKSAKAVLEYENKENGILIGHGNMALPVSDIRSMATLPWRFKFILKEEAKNDKFRVTYSNLIVINGAGNETSRWVPDDYDKVKTILLNMADEIGASIRTQQSNDTW